jgi:hypothetical protein
MAVEQSGAEAAPQSGAEAAPQDDTSPGPQDDTSPGPQDDTPPGPQDDTPPGPDDQSRSAQSDFDELKRKFREALDRKRGAHASAEGAHDTSKVRGSHGPAVSRRSFRRKSGG